MWFVHSTAVRYFRTPERRAISSAGSEHYLDKVGVAGSNPALPTRQVPQQEPTDPFGRHDRPYGSPADPARPGRTVSPTVGPIGTTGIGGGVTFLRSIRPKPEYALPLLFRKKVVKVEELRDEEIVAELQRRMDPERFGVLYDRYSTKVFQKCVGMTRNKEIAQDLTHDIFLKAFVNLTKFDHRSKFGTWLYSITYNFCLDHLRKDQKHRTTEVDEDHQVADGAEDRYEAELLAIRSERLPQVLEALAPTDQGILLMKYQEDLSVQDMMGVLGVSESAVKMRTMRARERALAKYHELFPEEP